MTKWGKNNIYNMNTLNFFAYSYLFRQNNKGLCIHNMLLFLDVYLSILSLVLVRLVQLNFNSKQSIHINPVGFYLLNLPLATWSTTHSFCIASTFVKSFILSKSQCFCEQSWSQFFLTAMHRCLPHFLGMTSSTAWKEQ